jgi:hypothetical protein
MLQVLFLAFRAKIKFSFSLMQLLYWLLSRSLRESLHQNDRRYNRKRSTAI